MDLTTPISELNKVGKVTAARLKNLGLATARDLLFDAPFRYDDFSECLSIDQLVAGQKANVVGVIELINNKRSARRRLAITEILVSDESGTLRAVWFNQSFLARILRVGDSVSLAGRVEEEYGQTVMRAPVYEKITPFPSPPCQGGGAIHTQGLVPHYNLTAGLTQKQLRFLIRQVIGLAARLVDWLPAEVKKQYGLIDLSRAVRDIHSPKNLNEAEAAKRRLAFDELFNLQLRAQLDRQRLKKWPAEPIVFQEEATKNFVAGLPFTLTDDQRRAAWEILQDLTKSRPMTRLLIGDVGSGKTVVALLAMLNAAWNGRQAALLAPTEILARQHFTTINRLLTKTDLKVGLITRTDKQINPTPDTRHQTSENQLSKEFRAKKISVNQIIENSDIIIGTHALLASGIKMPRLNLAVVDEQHRFGVAQRHYLLKQDDPEQKIVPHLLSMTATPIPRSLALALSDDLATSLIKEQPRGRLPIKTEIFADIERERAYEIIRREVAADRQAFIICPLIEESDKMDAKAATLEYRRLREEVFPDLRLGLVHGRLKTADKDSVMTAFMDGRIDILVATAVVEVGIDVPNATVMLVESADRFGLAQLHQYRGRVGRGEHQSYCFLATEAENNKARERLAAMLRFDNGFDLAKADLRFRGPGEVYGTVQKGFQELKIASLFDWELMRQAKTTTADLLAASPDLSKFPLLRDWLGEREKTVHWE